MFHDFVETSVTPNGERKYGKHPTQKPEGLIQHFVEILSIRRIPCLIHLWEAVQLEWSLKELTAIL